MTAFNFNAWWDFCQLPGNDGQADDASPGEPYATRYGFTYPTWITARRYAGFVDITMATFNGQTQAEMGTLALSFFWNRQGGVLMPSGVDVAVIDWVWTSGGAAMDIQRWLGVTVDGFIGPHTVAAMVGKGSAKSVAQTVRDMRLKYYEDAGLLTIGPQYGGTYPGLGTRADGCLALALSLAA